MVGQVKDTFVYLNHKDFSKHHVLKNIKIEIMHIKKLSSNIKTYF